MKPRHLLSAAEVTELQEFLDRKLDRVGVASRPEVALRLLDLSAKPDSKMKEYAAVVRMDHAMSGRILRLANSAIFAQRAPVTNLDRACLVLGLERIKAVSLGLQLSRAAAVVGTLDVSRVVWGQSVYRGCVAAEVARIVAPSNVPEAFVIGLMMDAGIPLMCKLVGDAYAPLYSECPGPGALFRRENDSLGFTHVDVVNAMARRWRLPELLARPIEWHHTRPTDTRRPEPLHRLHRIAYTVGLFELEARGEKGELQLKGGGSTSLAQRLLGLSEGEVGGILSRSVDEYSATIEMFSEVATSLADLDTLIERIHVGLVRAIDQTVEQDLQRHEGTAPTRLTVGGQSVEMVKSDDGNMVAYLYDTHGQRLLAHRFQPGDFSPKTLCDAFGLEITDPTEREKLMSFVVQQAA